MPASMFRLFLNTDMSAWAPVKHNRISNEPTLYIVASIHPLCGSARYHPGQLVDFTAGIPDGGVLLLTLPGHQRKPGKVNIRTNR